MEQSTAIIIVLFAAAALIAAIIMYLIFGEKKLRKRLDAQFGMPVTPPDYKEDNTGYWQARIMHEESLNKLIDDITWNDLDMDKIYNKINACQTSVGSEYLYSLLREPLFDNDMLEIREKLMSILDAAPQQRLDLQVVLEKMGKMPGNGLCSLCYDISSKKVKRPWLYSAFAALPLISAGLMFLNAVAGAICLFASFIINMAIYYSVKKRLSREMVSIRYFGAFTWAARKICRIQVLDEHPVGNEIREGFQAFKKLGGKLSGMARERITIIDAILIYLRIFFLSDIRNYNKIISVIEKHQSELRRLYQALGTLDAMIAVSSFRKTLPCFTCPEFIEKSIIETENIYHPLLTEPVPNTAALNGSTLVSGSNASGKSTFIKAIAVNGIFAQTIHTCTASLYRTRPALVMTSMAVRDDITAGESYFITEIKSLGRILKMIQETYCICFIDEILKGTNTAERIAASASVLNFVEPQDCMFVVATHDMELTRMLPGYANYHFGEQITDKGVQFDYTIKKGPTNTKNAIKLLEYMGYDEVVIRDAQALVNNFEDTGLWETLG